MPQILAHVAYSFHTAWEVRGHEVDQSGKLKDQEDESAYETVFEQGKVGAQNKADEKGNRDEVPWSRSTEELIDEKLFESTLDRECDKDEDQADVEQGSCLFGHHDKDWEEAQ